MFSRVPGRLRSHASVICAVAACAAALAGCGVIPQGPVRATCEPPSVAQKDPLPKGSRGVVGVYSAMPRSGVQAAYGSAVVSGAERLLREAKYVDRDGRFTIQLCELDDARAGLRDERRLAYPTRRSAADDALRGAENPRTIAFIGELGAEANAVAIPILNESSTLQISPGGGPARLTKDVNLRPSGLETFLRLGIDDNLQAEAAAVWAAEMGADTFGLVAARDGASEAMAESFARRARAEGLEGGRTATLDAGGALPGGADRALKGVDVVYYAGPGAAAGVRNFRRMHSVAPRAKLVAGNMAVDPGFFTKLGAAAGASYLTSAQLSPRQMPPSGRKVAAAATRPGAGGEAARAMSAYGYAAMEVVVRLMDVLGEEAFSRELIIEEAANADRVYRTAIGDIRFSNGNVSITRAAGYVVRDGKLRFARDLDARGRRRD